MNRRVIGLLLSLVFLLGALPPSFAAEEERPEVPVSAEETPVAVEPPAAETEAPVEADLYIDGAPITAVPTIYYNETTYVCLPLMAAALRADATYAWENDRVVVRADGLVLSAKWDNLYLEFNGRYLYIPDGVKHDEAGNTYVPVRTLAKALGVQVTWDGAVRLTTAGAAPLESGDTFYDAQSVDLLARVIYHESGNQPFTGQIAVGNVILNRVASPRFPNTIYDVIYAPGQFASATNCTPDAEAIVAAKLCLDGAVVLDNAYWFNGAGISCWASRNKPLVSVIGNHAFYGL
ncbi:MAG: copper amine oxidase [Clostridia bacterium]|nr:copper amine oxidase [Clostridia bacterium]